jgi:hypothetical protein
MSRHRGSFYLSTVNSGGMAFVHIYKARATDATDRKIYVVYGDTALESMQVLLKYHF